MSASGSLKDFVDEHKSRHSPYYPFSKFQEGIGDIRSKISINGLSSLSTGFLSVSTKDNPSASVQNGDSTSVDFSKESQSQKSSNGPTNASSPSMWSMIKNGEAFGLSRTQRIVGFFMCFLAGISCFGLASFYIPLIVFKARKFGALYTLGSCFFLFSFSLLWGPKSYIKHLFTQPRLPVTMAYLGTLLATLYCSLWIRSTLLTIVCVSVQVLALLWFVLSYIPGGETGLKFMASICKRMVTRSTAQSVLPI